MKLMTSSSLPVFLNKLFRFFQPNACLKDIPVMNVSAYLVLFMSFLQVSSSIDVTEVVFEGRDGRVLRRSEDSLSISGDWKKKGNDIFGHHYDDWFGRSVSLSQDGKTVAISSHANGTWFNGQTTVFRYSSNMNTWDQLGQRIEGEGTGDTSGRSISLSRNAKFLAIGSPHTRDRGGKLTGGTRIYEYDRETMVWIQLGPIINGEEGYLCGSSVALADDGHMIAIACPKGKEDDSNFGRVRIFRLKREHSINSWQQVGTDILENEPRQLASEWFPGRTIAVSGDGLKVAIGFSAYSTKNGRGVTKVYALNQTTYSWNQCGNDIIGESEGDHSGVSVALSRNGSILAIGATHDDNEIMGHDTGSAKVFQFNSNLKLWDNLGQSLHGSEGGSYSGNSVSLSDDGSYVAIGTFKNGRENSYTTVYSINPDTNVWTRLGPKIESSSGDAGTYSGYSVSLSGDGKTVAIGAPGDGGSMRRSGLTHIFTFEIITPTISPSPSISSRFPSVVYDDLDSSGSFTSMMMSVFVILLQLVILPPLL